MMKQSEKLQAGDTLKMRWCGNKTIAKFVEYKGVFDFVDRIAVFTDGTRMSLEKNRYYECECF